LFIEGRKEGASSAIALSTSFAAVVTKNPTKDASQIEEKR